MNANSVMFEVEVNDCRESKNKQVLYKTSLETLDRDIDLPCEKMIPARFSHFILRREALLKRMRILWHVLHLLGEGNTKPELQYRTSPVTLLTHWMRVAILSSFFAIQPDLSRGAFDPTGLFCIDGFFLPMGL
jgi:hypothetical protein